MGEPGVPPATYSKVSLDILKDYVQQPTCEEAYDTILAKHGSIHSLLQQLLDASSSDEERELLARALEKTLSIPSLAKQFLLERKPLALPPLTNEAVLTLACSSPLLSTRQFVASAILSLLQLGGNVEGMADMGLVAPLAVLLRDADGKTHGKAEQAILELAKETSTSKLVLSDSFLAPIEAVVEQTTNTEVQIRLLHFFVSLGEVSDEAFRICERRVYKHLLQMYFSDDLLVKLNILQIIEQLGSTARGIAYLSREEVPRMLVNDIAEDSLLDDAANICILRVVSAILYASPPLCEWLVKEKNGALPKRIQEYLEVASSHADAVAMQRGALHACGCLYSSLEGFDALQTYRPTMLHQACELIGNADSSISGDAVRCWTTIYESTKLKPCPEELVTFARTSVTPKVLDLLRRRPFSEVRVCCYDLLTALLQFDTTASLLCTSVDHMRLLLHNLSEDDLQSKYAKHRMVKMLLEGHQELLPRIVAESSLSALQRYVAGGPFYSDQGASVDIDKQAGQ